MQKFVLRHPTLVNSLAKASAGGVTVSKDHFVPFQRCANRVFEPPTMAYPTAVHPVVPEGQDRPVTTFELEPATFSDFSTIQPVPFHTSISEYVPPGVV
jgi:hypothetical protein